MVAEREFSGGFRLAGDPNLKSERAESGNKKVGAVISSIFSAIALARIATSPSREEQKRTARDIAFEKRNPNPALDS